MLKNKMAAILAPHITAKHVLGILNREVSGKTPWLTEYKDSIGRNKFANADVGIGKQGATGHASNFRPGVYYKRELDELRDVIGDNKASVTKRDFLNYKWSTEGSHPSKGRTGWLANLPVTSVPANEARDPDPNANPPEYLPYSLKGRRIAKDTISETADKFRRLPNIVDVSKNCVAVGGDSGFTHGYDCNPIINDPPNPYKVPKTSSCKERRSITQTDFYRNDFTKGRVLLPFPNRNNCTGYSTDTYGHCKFAEDTYCTPYERIYETKKDKLDNFETTYKAGFRGKPFLEGCDWETLRRKQIIVGKKEPTRYVANTW